MPPKTIMNLPPNMHRHIGSKLSGGNLLRFALSARGAHQAVRNNVAQRKKRFDALAALFVQILQEAHVATRSFRTAPRGSLVAGTQFKLTKLVAGTHGKLEALYWAGNRPFYALLMPGPTGYDMYVRSAKDVFFVSSYIPPASVRRNGMSHVYISTQQNEVTQRAVALAARVAQGGPYAVSFEDMRFSNVFSIPMKF